MDQREPENNRAVDKPVAHLEYSEALGRTIRSEDWSELGVFTQHKIQQAIRAGQYQLAIDLTNYSDENNWGMRVHIHEIISANLTLIAKYAGEEKVGDALRWIPDTTWNHPERLRPLMALDEYLAFLAEQLRAAHYQFHVEEEPDRFVFVLEDCATGGRLARLRDGVTGERFATVGRTTRGYPWSWGKPDIPYFCCMQTVSNEIIPIERRGAPDYVTECAAGEGPCHQYLYKSPELVPEEFYTRVGCVKPNHGGLPKQ